MLKTQICVTRPQCVNHGDDGEMMILNGRSNSYGGWKGGHVRTEEGDNDIWYNLAAYTGW